MHPSKDSHVDIHLTNGTLARGIVTEVNDVFIVLERKPAIHAVHGILEFEKVMINQKHIVAIGIRDHTNKY